MKPLRLPFAWSAVLLAAAACPAWAQGTRWSPVPGAPEVLLDLRSVQFRGATVRAWVRNLPAAAGLSALSAMPAGATSAQARSAVLAQFDCQARTLQLLATVAYDAAGQPLGSASVPGRATPVPQEPSVGWVYDALCEGARSIP